jgi:hypothetical protein
MITRYSKEDKGIKVIKVDKVIKVIKVDKVAKAGTPIKHNRELGRAGKPKGTPQERAQACAPTEETYLKSN